MFPAQVVSVPYLPVSCRFCEGAPPGSSRMSLPTKITTRPFFEVGLGGRP